MIQTAIRGLLLWTWLATMSWGSMADVQDDPQGRMVRVASARAPAQIPVYLHASPGAQAVLVMLPGGKGGIGPSKPGQWPGGGNFLIRSAPHFAAAGVHLALMSRPSDQTDMDYAFRISEAHIDDVRRVLEHVRATWGKPIWLVGTSRGTVSGTAVAIALQDQGLVDGLVLTASVVDSRKAGAVPQQALGQLRIPVLVVHHEQDACPVCRPQEVAQILHGLKSSPVKRLRMFRGGEPPRGDPCEAMHHHGFIGLEAEVARYITDWIQQPQP
jgi:hypothetical protein